MQERLKLLDLHQKMMDEGKLADVNDWDFEIRKTNASLELIRSKSVYESRKPLKWITMFVGIIFGWFTGDIFFEILVQNNKLFEIDGIGSMLGDVNEDKILVPSIYKTKLDPRK